MWRLPALIGKTFWPLAFAQRAFRAAEIRARAAADIFRRGLDDPVLYIPAKAASAAFSPFNCRATLSLSAFISAMMSMCSSAGDDCTGDQANTRVYQMWKWRSLLECDAIVL